MDGRASREGTRVGKLPLTPNHAGALARRFVAVYLLGKLSQSKRMAGEPLLDDQRRFRPGSFNVLARKPT